MPFDIFLSVFKLWLEHSQQLIKEENQSILTLCDYTELLTRLEPESTNSLFIDVYINY